MNKKIRCINIRDNIWELIKKISELENRSISNLIECLILKEAKKSRIN